MDNKCPCSTGSDRPSNPILFNILSQMDTSEPGQSSLSYTSMPHRCNCEQRRTVCLKRPSEMPPNDQFSLLRSCWAPLFILGLAQERVDFEVTDTPADSMLKRILLNRQESPRAEKEQPTLAGVSKLRSCLKKFWSLDLSPKEYAYLKGTAIFNPDVPDLKAALFVESLQQEAQHALREVVLLLHQEDHERFARILLTASMLQSITPSLISELFFRPVIGQADLLELMVDMLFFR
ncbi:nuclear receptor subfamily 0 group B member 2a isoform X2 [Takifugu rubripes]|uniref:nuclear receptor subfamily 0 group B member 2a isoform X2 n=1 Tax=Takifugu rubripes TaxID=31033 RepID=UPI0005D1FAE0|nr:nuclear receptor subfamily 0 group B member 2-like isoform X2 [Takifugu rubripes]|eukprot:XP_011603829.1 PREDICTED: nuclear receptor subfamily 0 group B member 2-like isoform X2 [Takifugu rubripes]